MSSFLFNVKLVRGKAWNLPHLSMLKQIIDVGGGGGGGQRELCTFSLMGNLQCYRGKGDHLPFLLYRVLQWSTFIDRTFCTETEDERRSWIESINRVAKDLIKKQKEEAPSSTGGLKPTEGVASPKQGIKVRGEREREREGELCGRGSAITEHVLYRFT